MTASVQPESKPPSRRALLAGALGGLGALAASAIGRASPVQAANGDPVVVGGTHTGTGITQIQATGGSAFHGLSTFNGGAGLIGSALSATETNYGVLGQSAGSTGFGVYGYAYAASGTTVGVLGRSSSPSGVGVQGQSSNGLALRANGRAQFSTSGVATINAGSTSKTITPGVNVTSGSFVLLTPKANIGTRALWFTTDAPNNRFTIRMSSARSSGTKVAWLLLG
jgi:hypothetical protein